MEQSNLPPAPPQDQPSAVMEEVPQGTPIRLLMGAVGGLLAAVVGAFIWGQIINLTDYEAGIVAIGMGFLCGYAVLKLSQGGSGFLYQLIAVGSSVLGIFFGKYYGVYILFRKVMVEDYGSEILNELPSLFSGDMFFFFLEILPEFLSFYDILWVGLAVYYAWKMLSPKNIQKQAG